MRSSEIEDGRFLWPGFGENVRVLKWIFERVARRVPARSSPIGLLPTTDTLDLSNLEMAPERLEALLAVDARAWLSEVADNEAFLTRFGENLPTPLWGEHRTLRDRLRFSTCPA